MTIRWSEDEDPGWGEPRPVDAPGRPVKRAQLPVPASDPVDAPGPSAQLPARPWESVPDEPIVGFARDVLGFDLTERQASILSEIYRDSVRTAVLRLGRRSGKGRIASIVATYEATVGAEAHLRHVPAGERIAIVVVATSQRQAGVVHRYVRGYFAAPALAPLVVRDTVDELELGSGIVIMTIPATSASGRGLAVAVVILDEAAWFLGVDGSPLDVGEVFRALVPATAQFPARRTLVLSTPRLATGWFAELVAAAESGAFADMRAWHASTSDMNPRLADFVEAERAKDPTSAAREYDALFDSGIGAVLDVTLVRAAIRSEGELPPAADMRYVVALDAGFVADRSAVLVGHRDGQRIVVDAVRGWHGSKDRPTSVDAVLEEIAALAVTYGGARVIVDQYAAQPIMQGLRSRGPSGSTSGRGRTRARSPPRPPSARP